VRLAIAHRTWPSEDKDTVAISEAETQRPVSSEQEAALASRVLILLQAESFKQRYHERSNVETTLSMIKSKFGDGLRSKTRTAQINEALCKVLAHNLCCLIQSIYELGIEPTFWEEAA